MSRIVTMWELSTAHVTPTERLLLDDLCDGEGGLSLHLPRFIWHNYGWIFPVTDENKQRNLDMLPSIATIYAAASKRGVKWVYLDRDADEDPNLPTYDD